MRLSYSSKSELIAVCTRNSSSSRSCSHTSSFVSNRPGRICKSGVRKSRAVVNHYVEPESAFARIYLLAHGLSLIPLASTLVKCLRTGHLQWAPFTAAQQDNFFPSLKANCYRFADYRWARKRTPYPRKILRKAPQTGDTLHGCAPIGDDEREQHESTQPRVNTDQRCYCCSLVLRTEMEVAYPVTAEAAGSSPVVPAKSSTFSLWNRGCFRKFAICCVLARL